MGDGKRASNIFHRLGSGLGLGLGSSVFAIHVGGRDGGGRGISTGGRGGGTLLGEGGWRMVPVFISIPSSCAFPPRPGGGLGIHLGAEMGVRG